MPKTKPPPKPKGGRPRGRTRIQKSLSMPPDLWAWLDSQMLQGETRNDAATRILSALRETLARQ